MGLGSLNLGVTNLGSLAIYLRTNMTDMKAGLDQAGVAVKAFVNNTNKTLEENSIAFNRLGKSATKLGLILTGVNIIALKFYGDFERSMRKATAVSNASEIQFKQMTDMAQKQAVAINKSAVETADAFYYLGSAGLSVADQMKAFTGTTTLAKAAVLDVGWTAEHLVDIMKGFNIGFEKTNYVTDMLTSGVTSSNMTFAQLGETMKMISSVAYETNNSLADTVAIVGEMANVGIKGTRAGTTLRRALLNLVNPSDEMKDMLRQWNLTIFEANGEMKPFIKIIGDIGNAMRDATSQQKMVMFETLFGVRAITGQLRLLSVGEKKLKEFSDSITNDFGRATTVANKQLTSFNEQLGITKQQWMALTREIGDSTAPMMLRLNDVFRNLGMSTTNLFKSNQWLAQSLGVSGMVMGGYLTVAGKTLSTVSQMSMVFLATSVSVKTLGMAMGGIGLAVTAVATVLVMLISRTREYGRVLKEIRDTQNQHIEQLKEMGTEYHKAYERMLKEDPTNLNLERMRIYEKHTAEYLKKIKETKDRITALEATINATTVTNNGMGGYTTSRLNANNEAMKKELSDLQAMLPKFEQAYDNMLKRQVKGRMAVISNVDVQDNKQNVETREKLERQYSDEIKAMQVEIMGFKTNSREAELLELDNWYERMRIEYANFKDELAIIDELYEEKKKSITENGFSKYKRDIGDTTKYYNDQMYDLAGNVEGAMGEMNYSVMMGTQGIEDAFSSMVTSIWQAFNQMIAKMIARYLMLAMLESTLGSAFSGMFMGAAAGAGVSAGGGTIGTGGGMGNTITSSTVLHDGGMVGFDNAMSRNVDSNIFNQAPRLHGGINAGEYPAILEYGEKVKSKGNSSTPDVEVNITNNSSNAIEKKNTRTSFDGKKFVVDVVINDINRKGPIADALKGMGNG